VTIVANENGAFAALKTDGSVVCWGDAWSGGDVTSHFTLGPDGLERTSVETNEARLQSGVVSIVANYIKERTKDAQFIIISLRNNMFELADRLVGIYKTCDVTKSVTINPKKIAAEFLLETAAPAAAVSSEECSASAWPVAREVPAGWCTIPTGTLARGMGLWSSVTLAIIPAVFSAPPSGMFATAWAPCLCASEARPSDRGIR
jgi:hypothetical protein